MAIRPDKDAQFHHKHSMPWFEEPEIERAWCEATRAADQAALEAGAFKADLIVAHLMVVKDLGGWDAKRFEEVLALWGKSDV